jgi:hypothetical protein
VKSTSLRSHLQQAFRPESPEDVDGRLGEVMKLRRDQEGEERQDARVNAYVSRDENGKRVKSSNRKEEESLL